jgi:quinohemoprotein ethanol dehydrogenase
MKNLSPGVAAISAVTLSLLLNGCQPDNTESKPASAEPKQVSAEPKKISTAGAVSEARMLAADAEPGNWMAHGRTYSEQRYSPLGQITTENVDKLGLAWSFDFSTKRGIEATSIVVDGVMYATASWSIVHALDARTGKSLWTYDPQVARDKIRHGCCGSVNRGVAVRDGQVFVGVYDGRLVALDAKSGKVNWEVATVDAELPYTITGAPRVIEDKVIIGNGGAEFGVRGFLAAYDTKSGKQVWKFYTVPGNPELGFENDAMKMAADTWNGSWWELGGGGGTVWDSMAYDPDLNLLYFGVGNGTPWNREIRSPGGGDNLFLSSIVAVNPDTGEYVWHYQTTPGESWDYTATQHIILADMEIDGSPRKVLMQAPKNGFFYVLDRTNGKLISADNYIDINWATHVDMETGRPVEVPGARYKDSPYLTSPSYLGGHNWHPMSYNPGTGLVYIPVLDMAAAYGQPEHFTYRPGSTNTGTDPIIGNLPSTAAEREALRPLFKGRLLAWDPVKQEEAWRVEHTGPWNGGTLSTAGELVFQGTADGKFTAFRADNGDKLWAFPAQTGIVAPPISYELDGEQYVSINVGWGGAYALVFGEYVQPESMPNVSRVLTFKLGADLTLPPVEWRPTVYFHPPARPTDKAALRDGEVLYQDICMGCHGLAAISGLIVPDLRGSAWLHDPEGWNRVVREGLLRENGMADFSAYLSREQSDSIRSYVIEQAWQGKEWREQQDAEK